MLDCATDVLPEQQSGVLPEQQSGVLPEQQSGVLPEQQSGVLPEQQSGVLPELVSATPWSIQHLRCGYDAANLGTKMVEEIISCCKKKMQYLCKLLKWVLLLLSILLLWGVGG